jgi:hypothetical protein
MLGDAPLGAEPLGGFPGVTTLESTEGGAAKFPAPILHRPSYAMAKYLRKRGWFEDEFLATWEKKGLAGLKEDEEKPLTVADILGWGKWDD